MDGPEDDGARQDPRTEALPDRDGGHTPIRQFSLLVVAGPDSGRTFTSASQRTRLGNHERADLILKDPTVSRFHCEIVVQRDAVTIRDLESLNGTRVEGVPIVAARLLDGAAITIGRTTLRFSLGEGHVDIPVSKAQGFGSMVGQSPAARAVFALLEKAARTDVTVLLQGETGTGKDLAAESIHAGSARKDGPFVVIDCGSIAPTLLESELFGHERGAFTGADVARAGAFATAHGGTLFLDEIGELALELQPKLLRSLEERVVRPIGGATPRAVDVRIIAATNRDLVAEVNAGRFRSDLYYRLAVLEVTLPPLRERLEDLPLLVAKLLEAMAVVGGPEAERLTSPRFFGELARQRWPGNVRELRNYLETSLYVEPAPAQPPGREGPPTVDIDQPLRMVRERWIRYVEREYLREVLKRSNNNVTAAARAAGLDRVHFHRLLTRSGLRQGR